MPRGEVLEIMLGAFMATRDGISVTAALDALRRPEPGTEDRAAGRMRTLTFFATREVEEGLAELARVRAWTLGAVIEDTMAKVARMMAASKGSGDLSKCGGPFGSSKSAAA